MAILRQRITYKILFFFILQRYLSVILLFELLLYPLLKNVNIKIILNQNLVRSVFNSIFEYL